MSDANPSRLIVHSTPHPPEQILENLKRIFQAKGITVFAYRPFRGSPESWFGFKI